MNKVMRVVRSARVRKTARHVIALVFAVCVAVMGLSGPANVMAKGDSDGVISAGL